MIDFDETIKAYEGKIENFKEKLMKANDEFMAIEKTVDGKKMKFNEAHKKAYAAAKASMWATGCTRELPRELKKRNALAKPSLTWPKAAKSMRVKARKLGFVA